MRIKPIVNDSAPVGELVAEHNSVTEAGEVATYEERPGKERKKVVLNEPNYVVSVKAEFQGEFRRFPLKTLSFEKLEAKVRELYDLPAHLRISIFYFDGDNDRITLSSDQDLSFVAHELYSVPLIGDRDPCLKIQVKVKEERRFEATREPSASIAATFQTIISSESFEDLIKTTFPLTVKLLKETNTISVPNLQNMGFQMPIMLLPNLMELPLKLEFERQIASSNSAPDEFDVIEIENFVQPKGPFIEAEPNQMS
eukprot:CAMPEP_0184336302 /NCGR_PEP_ID=MMETSP1089-20130417/4646_1 /TAXON_ID=38269 ORGANISM="Gloeochaete wittrockiana, Strain SAG46.84" /NCGR_SAMPLE_ID=MMETSP1089 /ASSEMBLY_ACC=CAM_ASM_000445 /LENGTH=254 /DNA_ID=CAMNT_0026661285 /DNA_START=36 /DNA_END=797 /DNA_ORIENTATION=+